MTQCQLWKWVGKVGEMKQENNSRKKCVSDGEIRDSRSSDGMTEIGLGAVTSPKKHESRRFSWKRVMS